MSFASGTPSASVPEVSAQLELFDHAAPSVAAFQVKVANRARSSNCSDLRPANLRSFVRRRRLLPRRETERTTKSRSQLPSRMRMFLGVGVSEASDGAENDPVSFPIHRREGTGADCCADPRIPSASHLSDADWRAAEHGSQSRRASALYFLHGRLAG